MKQFKAPEESIGDLDADAAATLIAAAADIALILDREGAIRDVAFDSEDLDLDNYETWLGRPWLETVTLESRPKIEELLKDAVAKTPPRWRQVNHPSSQSGDVPVLYSAVQVGRNGRIVAVGRDLRAIAAMQQRLIDAQQSMERDYSRLRHVETQYRMLFQKSAEAVLLVDAATQKVAEANPMAGKLLGKDAAHLVGHAFPFGFDAKGTQAVQEHLDRVRIAGRAEDVRAHTASDGCEVVVSASLLRQDKSSMFLVHVLHHPADSVSAIWPKTKTKVLKVVERAPDGFVVTALDGRIITANPAFLDLAELTSEEQARGQSLDRWMGRAGVDLNVLMANLREHGSIRLFATTLRGEYGSRAEVEISAVSVENGDNACFGFAIRNVGRRLAAEPERGRKLPQSVEQLTELVGRVALKDVVREATDVIERLCIETALEMTGDNRASAAELLGLSRQSLYVKLRRYGFGDLAAEGDK